MPWGEPLSFSPPWTAKKSVLFPGGEHCLCTPSLFLHNVLGKRQKLSVPLLRSCGETPPSSSYRSHQNYYYRCRLLCSYPFDPLASASLTCRRSCLLTDSPRNLVPVGAALLSSTVGVFFTLLQSWGVVVRLQCGVYTCC